MKTALLLTHSYQCVTYSINILIWIFLLFSSNAKLHSPLSTQKFLPLLHCSGGHLTSPVPSLIICFSLNTHTVIFNISTNKIALFRNCYYFKATGIVQVFLYFFKNLITDTRFRDGQWVEETTFLVQCIEIKNCQENTSKMGRKD